MTMSGMNSEFQPEPENKSEFGLRRLAVTTLPVVVLMALSFGYGYSQNQPVQINDVADAKQTSVGNPEQVRNEVDLTSTIVKARVQSHLERHACLSQLQFTSVELQTESGDKLEAMLPLQVTTLESAKELFPIGKVESFRLGKVDNLKASDGSELYAIADAAMRKQ